MKVTALVVTYNHASYIDQAIESVLAQQTPFDVELLVSEDASTDGTREKVLGWAARYPTRIRLLLSQSNLHTNEVVARGFEAAQGEYLALLDGDDFWTDPLKLAAQAAHLDAHPDLAMCFHNARVVDGEGRLTEQLWTRTDHPPRISLQALWDGNPFATCGSMFRRALVPRIPPWYFGFFPVTDWPLYLLYAEQGDIGFVPQATGAYRLHAGGLYSSLTAAAKHAAVDDFYRRIDVCFEHRHRRAIRRAHFRYFADWTLAHLQRGERPLARQSLALAAGFGRPVSLASAVELARLALRLHIPRAGRPGPAA